MCMAKYFESIQRQLKMREEFHDYVKGEIKKKIEEETNEKATVAQIE